MINSLHVIRLAEDFMGGSRRIMARNLREKIIPVWGILY